MTVDKKGEIVDHVIAETVIRVDQRMSYTSVAKILEAQDEQERQKYEKLVPMFEQMAEVSGLLRERRKKRGAIDFDFPETKMILDEQGRPVELKPYERNVATKMIEDLCLRQMKQWQKSISGERFRFYIVPMRRQKKIR